MSKDTGIAQSTIASWKSRGLTPKYETLKKLSDYFDVTMDYLLGFTSRKESPYEDSTSKPYEQITHEYLNFNLKASQFPKIDFDCVDTRQTLQIMKLLNELNNEWLENGRLSMNIDEEEALIGLKFILTSWRIPWKKYGDNILLSVVKSKVFKDSTIKMLDILEEVASKTGIDTTKAYWGDIPEPYQEGGKNADKEDD